MISPLHLVPEHLLISPKTRNQSKFSISRKEEPKLFFRLQLLVSHGELHACHLQTDFGAVVKRKRYIGK